MKIVFNKETKTFALKNQYYFDKNNRPHYNENDFQSVYKNNKRYKDLKESEARGLYESTLRGADSVIRSRNESPNDSEGNLIYEKVNRGAHTAIANKRSGNLDDSKMKEKLDNYKKQLKLAGLYKYSTKDTDERYNELEHLGKDLPTGVIDNLDEYYTNGEGKEHMHEVKGFKPNIYKDGKLQQGDMAFFVRPFKIASIDGHKIPYYMSSGQGNKTDVPTKRWYPVFGMKDGWLNKTHGQEINKAYDMPVLKYIKRDLDINNPYSSEFDDEGFPLNDKYIHMNANDIPFMERKFNTDMNPVSRNASSEDMRKNINQFKDKIR